ncbi:type III-A CRISPR-associated RAMP protein Csm5 [Marinitoga arctica]
MSNNAKLKILSPLHIGDGNEIFPIEYFKYKGFTYFVNDKILISSLSDVEQKEFLDWIKSKYPENLNSFLDNKNRSNKTIEQLVRKSIRVTNENVDGNIKTIMKIKEKAYIPGSEIKGAIRTAIVYYILKNDESLYNKLKSEMLELQTKFEFLVEKIKNKKGNLILYKKEIEKIKNISFYLFKKVNYDQIKKANIIKVNTVKKFLSKEIQKVSKFIEKKALILHNQQDAKYDILKNLIISDTFPNESEVKIGKINTLNMSRKGSEWIEYIYSGKFEFSLHLNNESHKKLVDITKDNQKKDILNLDFIKTALYEYSKSILNVEKEYFKNNSEVLSKIQNYERLNTIENPLIRLGKYKGYLSNTVSIIIKEKDPELYDGFLVHCTKNTSYTKEKFNKYFPKTRRVLDNNIMGWCKLEIN